MKKERYPAILILAAILLIIGFAVRLTADLVKDYEFGSAPVYLYVLVRAVEFLLPALVLFILGVVFLKKKNKQ